MPLPWVYALVSVVGVSLVSLIGLLTLAVNDRQLKQLVTILVGLAVGAMFGNVCFHLLPESFDGAIPSAQASVGVLVGLFGFFMLESGLRWHHHHLEPHDIHPTGYINLIADGLHNFIDGFLIGASYLVSTPVGVTTTIAILLHEIPQEIGDFGVLLHSGFSRVSALGWNLVSALTAVLGTLLALAAGTALVHLPEQILPVTAGTMMYVAGSDLVPELHKTPHGRTLLLQLVALAVGVGLIWCLVLAFPH